MMQKKWAVGQLLGVLAVVGLGLSVWGQTQTLTVATYSDAVRFAAQGAVKELRVEILSLAGQKVFDSGFVQSSALDWRMLNREGQPVASGVYLYSVTVKDEFGNLTKKLGKLALVRGKAGQVAPPLTLPTVGELSGSKERLQPLGFVDLGNVTYCCVPDAEKLGVGTSTVGAAFKMSVLGGGMEVRRVGGDGPFLVFHSQSDETYAPVKVDFTRTNAAGGATPNNTNIAQYRFTGVTTTGAFYIGGSIVASTGVNTPTGFPLDWVFRTNPGTGEQDRLWIRSDGNVGIPTSNASAKLHIANSASQPGLRIDSSAGTNALEIYNTEGGANLIFRVERTTGNVYADGSFTGGGADVAERIDTTEPLEAGDVVEIDSENPGKFRKARESISTRAAGVISTAPGVVLGNEKQLDGGSDVRPILALAGRVPVKVTAKYGAIEIGDLLVSSPIPGYAMKCPEASKCIGAVIGKALEPLKEGVAKIEAQVMLR